MSETKDKAAGTDEALNVGLPKWPALVVVGSPVTPDQAAEIIVRTGHYPLSLNDRRWMELVHESMGITTDGDGWPNYESAEAAKDRYGVLDLEYIGNYRIGSSWIGGPNGWVGWDGRVGSCNSNIGKWPDAVTVCEEWRKVAEAFPYLTLRCQLMDRESCEEGQIPLVEYVVHAGAVTAIKPTQKIGDGVGAMNDHSLLSFFTNPFRERGCTREQLRRALDIASQSLAARTK